MAVPAGCEAAAAGLRRSLWPHYRWRSRRHYLPGDPPARAARTGLGLKRVERRGERGDCLADRASQNGLVGMQRELGAFGGNLPRWADCDAALGEAVG